MGSSCITKWAFSEVIFALAIEISQWARTLKVRLKLAWRHYIIRGKVWRVTSDMMSPLCPLFITVKAFRDSPDFGAERRKRKSNKSNTILRRIYSSLKGRDDMFMFTIFVQILPGNITILWLMLVKTTLKRPGTGHPCQIDFSFRNTMAINCGKG